LFVLNVRITLIMLRILIILIAISQFFWTVKIGYPPSLEQINLGINTPASLFFIRIISLIIFLFTCFLVLKSLKKAIKPYFLFFIFSIPAITSWIISYPTIVIRLFLIVLLSFFISKIKPSFRSFLFIILAIYSIYLLNVSIFKLRPVVIETLDLKSNQIELTHRIYSEDEINPKIDLPLSFRRLGYNKYLFAFKNFSNLSLKFLDLESLFFEEVHPLSQKGFVLFTWPLIWLFILSLIFYIKKIIVVPSLFLYSLFFGFISYLFSDQFPEHYLAPVIFIVCFLLASTISFLFNHKQRILKYLVIFFLVISLYSYTNNLLDRFKRPDFWLDNRPLIYQTWFNRLKEMPLADLKIIMTDIVGPSSSYCHFFLKNCQNFTFTNFDFSSSLPQKDVVYIGFVGNFLGRQNQNSFGADQEYLIALAGHHVIDSFSFRDDVVFGYGNNTYITQYHEPKTK
jgi:hypothetical protein